MKNEKVLQVVVFDKKVKTYWYLQGIWVNALMIFTVIGLFTLPIWILVGVFVCQKRYEHLSATLTETSIHLKKGYIMKVEKTIPLEKIQDLGMRTGPLLNLFGLASIQIETAGGSGQQGADMALSGVVNPSEFRDAVLTQRGVVTQKGTAVQQEGSPTVELLTEIRDSLGRIENLLDRS